MLEKVLWVTTNTMACALVMVVIVSLTQSSFITLASPSQDPFRLEREMAARKWSPLVWLHPAEDFFPSSVPFFLQHITPSTEQGQAVTQQGSATPQLYLPPGRPSQNLYLLAPHNFGCLDCTLPEFLHGQKPQKKYSPPLYVVINTCPPQPSARAVKSTQKSLPDDMLINDNIQFDDDVDDTTTITTFSQTANASTFSNQNSTMQPNTSSPYSNHTYSLLNTSPELNQTQAGQTHTFVSTVGARNSQNTSYEENATTTFPSICTNNGSLCYTSTSDGKTNNTMNNTLIPDNAKNLHTRNVGVMDNHLLNTTKAQYTNESQTMRDEFNEFLNSSLTRSQYNIQMDDTDDLTNTSKLTRGQYHNSNKRHIQQFNDEDESTPYEQQYSVTYWMFYPYNRGKKICTVNLGFFLGHMLKPKLYGVCHGEEITVGNHVGDWEHISIQFHGSRPHRMYVSTHTFGAYYTYDPQHHRFVYESQDTREGIPLSPVYPKTIELIRNHPILYSARGSHGLWGAEGINQYNSLPVLQDETGKGTPWKTWMNLKLIDEQDPTSLQPHRHWWRYEGRWGNPSTKCHALLAGFCEHVKGPTGIPRKRVNFPCINM